MADAYETLEVGKIKKDKGRAFVYPRGDDSFHLIASEDEVKSLAIGDTVEYEPCGLNVGWFVSKKVP